MSGTFIVESLLILEYTFILMLLSVTMRFLLQFFIVTLLFIVTLFVNYSINSSVKLAYIFECTVNI